MITGGKFRAASAAIASAILLTLAAAVPALAAPTDVASSAYPIDRGVIRLTIASGEGPALSPTVLQETNEEYWANSDARNVVGSPGEWNSDQQRWRLIQTGAQTYRFINVASGRALQSTNEESGARYQGYNLVTTPASWNSPQQEFRIEVEKRNQSTFLHIWGKTPRGEKEVGLSNYSYNGGPVYWATVSTGYWAVDGVAF